MSQIDAGEKTLEKLAELQARFSQRSIEMTLAHVIDRFHAAYVSRIGELPNGWTLDDDLTLDHFEAYYKAYDTEEGGSAWHERGRAIRAAIIAGWFSAPDGLTIQDAGKLKPAMAARVKDAIDAHYVRLVTADPNG